MKSGKKSRRAELLGKLWDLGRRMSTQTVFLHEAIARTAGLSATDTKCIDLILRGGGEKGVTAGYLSEKSGLTTGAITHILDRLERGGFVQRVRDKEDRRKVFVRVSVEKLEDLVPKYEAIGKAYLEMLGQYDDEELGLICEYLEKTAEVSEKELGKIRNPKPE